MLNKKNQDAIRYKHEHRFMACSCNWSEPCQTIQLLNDYEELEDKLTIAFQNSLKRRIANADKIIERIK